jgi:hypothetical protein
LPSDQDGRPASFESFGTSDDAALHDMELEML